MCVSPSLSIVDLWSFAGFILQEGSGSHNRTWCAMIACAMISFAVCATFHVHVFLLHSMHHIEGRYREFWKFHKVYIEK